MRLRLRLRVGPHWIGWLTGAPRSSVYAVLRRLGLNRLRALEPREPVVRYCWPRAGDLVHLDTKKLGRIGPGGGWRFVGARASRTATAASAGTSCTWPSTTPPGWPTPRSCPTSSGTTAAAFLERALAFYAAQGIERAAPAHRQRRALPLARLPRRRSRTPACATCFTRPYRPQTNGKAEAFVKIAAERLGLPAALRER